MMTMGRVITLLYLLGIIIAAVTALYSCAGSDPGKNQPPRYPNSRYITDESGKREAAGTMVYWSMFETFDYWPKVVEFYSKEMKGKPGWEEKTGKEMCVWTNGNISLDKHMAAEDPVDPTRAGGYIFLMRGEGRTFIYLAWSDPKK